MIWFHCCMQKSWVLKYWGLSFRFMNPLMIKNCFFFFCFFFFFRKSNNRIFQKIDIFFIISMKFVTPCLEKVQNQISNKFASINFHIWTKIEFIIDFWKALIHFNSFFVLKWTNIQKFLWELYGLKKKKSFRGKTSLRV